MIPYAIEGTYRTTGLPLDDEALFRAWQFLHVHRGLQPALYQNGFTLRLAKRLIENGERDIAVTAGALLCMMPATVSTPIERTVSRDTAATIDEFNRHKMTSFAYIDQASREAQKIALSYLIDAMASMQKRGDTVLEALAAAKAGATVGQVELKGLTDPRAFLLAADKCQDSTGNTRLENVFIDAALEYKVYYEGYLQQLLASGLLSREAQAAIGARLSGDPALPRLHETALPVSDTLLNLYAQLCMDPRVPFERMVEAIRLAEIIADSGETSPAMLGAALLSGCLAHIGPSDARFLEKIGAGDMVDVLRDNTAAAKAQLPLMYMPVSAQQIELAHAIALLRDSQELVDQLQERLDSVMRDAPVEHRQLFVARGLMSVQSAMQDLQTGLWPQLNGSDCPALCDEVQAQYRLLSHMITRISDTVRLSGPQPQRRPEPGL